jgi:hypothetical protein
MARDHRTRAAQIRYLVQGDLRALTIPSQERAFELALSPAEASIGAGEPVRLGEYLRDHNLISADVLAAALAEQGQRIAAGHPIALGDLLVEQGHLTVHQLVNMLMLQHLDRVRRTAPAMSPRLGELLVRTGVITAQQLATVLTMQTEARQRGEAVRLGKILIEAGLITRPQLAKILVYQRQARYAKPATTPSDANDAE